MDVFYSPIQDTFTNEDSKQGIPDERRTHILSHGLVEGFGVEHLDRGVLVKQPSFGERRQQHRSQEQNRQPGEQHSGAELR